MTTFSATLPSPRSTRAAFAARAMRRPLRAMMREIVGVRRNVDIECVHRMRVASRRLRNTLALFESELPGPARSRWKKRLRKVTRSLGAARDLDVQLAFLAEYRQKLPAVEAADLPGIDHLIALLRARRQAAQADVNAALESVQSSGTLADLAGWVKGLAASGDPSGADRLTLRGEALRAVQMRLAELMEYEPYVEQPRAVEKLHDMRIAAKHLRYTLEVFATLYAGGLKTQIDGIKQIQDWLGEIHDCDVWRDQLDQLIASCGVSSTASTPGPPDGTTLLRGLRNLRKERAARRRVVYREFRDAWRCAAATSAWQDFMAPLLEDIRATRGELDETWTSPPGRSNGRPGDESKAVLALAASCRYEVAHTQQVTRLALRIFDQLRSLHGLGDTSRAELEYASTLHDIGWMHGRAGHNKTALRLILESPLLPWDLRRRRKIGLIARYHRKGTPRADHDHYRDLSAADQSEVRTLAAILRVADGLDYSHQRIIADLTCRVTPEQLLVVCRANGPADIECSRALEKGDLAVRVFNRELSISWQPR